MTSDAPEARRETLLALQLRQRIQRNGPIPLSTFMSDCLWDAAHGYYATRTPIGAAGDFITAPEISQTFGELIGLWCAVVWQQMGSPSTITLVEAGPGRGTLLRDALRAIETVPRFRNAVRVHLLEASPSLREIQRATLAPTGIPLTWSAFGEPWTGPTILIGNEFLDCLPVDQAIKTDAGWRLRTIGLDAAGHLALGVDPVGRTFGDLDTRFPDAPRGSVFEFTKIAEPLIPEGPSRDLVAALYIDYGHASPALGETAQAVRAHRHEHILTSPGEADVSAHVDFTAVAQSARAKSLAVDGPVTQAEFLGSLGIMERAARLIAANPARVNDIETGVARLMNPQGMGTRFKAIAIRSPSLPPLPGFPVPL